MAQRTTLFPILNHPMVDHFVPERLRGAGSLEEQKSRLLPFFMLALALWGPIFAPVFYLQGSTAGALFMLVGTVVIALGPFLLRWTGSLRLAGNYLAGTTFVTLVGMLALSGGTNVSTMAWCVLVPIFANVFVGVRSALSWGAALLVSFGVLSTVEHTDAVQLPVLIPPGDDVVALTGTTALIFVVWSIFWLNGRLQDWSSRAAERREAELRATLEAVPDPILRLDEDGHVQFWNQASLEAFETQPEELEGSHIATLIARETGTKSIVHGSRDQEDVPMGQRPDGSIFPAQVEVRTIESVSAPGRVVVARDITEELEAEEGLRRARDKAVAASRAKSEFLANISHELRTPLNAVIGYSELLMEDLGRSDISSQRADLERIHQSAQHLLLLINDVLSLSKIESGKMEPHYERFELPDLIEEVGQTVRPLAEKAGNSLKMRVGKRVSTVRSDPMRIRQILLNLLGNACKFTEDGQVELRASLEGAGDERKMVLEVIDTGIGMSEGELDRVFDSFTQADGSTTRKYGGTGLGLTITSHLVDMLRGEMNVDSKPGVGTRFRISLPAD
ncbi:MAG: ATP-binding protein [Myxococcota bacterium]